METKILESFLAAATYLNFTRAAESLYMTQPALSKHISELEQELGVPLFIRDKRSVRLTTQGQAILPVALNILERISLMRKIAQDTTPAINMPTLFSVGIDSRLFQNTPVKLCISHSLTDLMQEYPSLQCDISCLQNRDTPHALKQHQNDVIVLLHYQTSNDGQIIYMPLLEDQLSIVIARSKYQELMDSGHCNPAFIFDNMDVLLIEQDAVEIAAFTQLITQLDATPHLRHYGDINRSFMTLSSGNGVFLVPKAHRANAFPEEYFAFLDIDSEAANVSYGLAWLPGNTSPYIEQFFAIFKKNLLQAVM